MGTIGLAVATLIYFFTRDLSPLGAIFINYCLIALAFLSLFFIVKGFKKPERLNLVESRLEINRVTAGLIMLAAYLALISAIGYLFASLGFYLVFSSYLAKKPFGLRAVAIAAISSAMAVFAIYAVFHYFLQVPLPAGAFF